MRVIKHILKLFWNRKKKYYGIFVEQAMIMLVLMICLVEILDMVKKYRTPGLLDTDNTILCGWKIINENMTQEEAYNLFQNYESVTDNLKQLPYVQSLAKSNSLAPYIDIFAKTTNDSVEIDNRKMSVYIKGSDEHGISVFRPVLEEGKWLSNKILDDGTDPMVITRQLANREGWTNAIGKKMMFRSRTFTVVGVIAGLKHHPFDPSPSVAIIPMYLFPPWETQYVVRLKGNQKEDFFLAYYNETKRQIGLDVVEPAIVDIETLKDLPIFLNTIWLILFGIAIIFLTFFAFIGAFGLYWLYAQKNLQEYALRMALGSTRKQLIQLVVAESLLVSCFAVLPSLALFFYIYTSLQLHGFVIATGFIFLFSMISSWFPAWMVSKINPAKALQYE